MPQAVIVEYSGRFFAMCVRHSSLSWLSQGGDALALATRISNALAIQQRTLAAPRHGGQARPCLSGGGEPPHSRRRHPPALLISKDPQKYGR